MAFTRIAKGTAATKVAGTQLSPPDFSINAYSLIEVGVTYKSLTIFPESVKFGIRDLILVPGSRVSEPNSEITTEKWRAVVSGTNTRTLRIKWPEEINARACYVTEIQDAGPKDTVSTNAQVSTTNPTTGPAVTTTEADTFHICAFGSNGPVEDAVGTIQVGHISGQRAGTTGGVAATNVTIHETYEVLTAVGDCRAAKIATTASRWANSITAYAEQTGIAVDYVGGIEEFTNSELEAVKDAVYDALVVSDTALNASLPSSAQTNLSAQQKRDIYIAAVIRFPIKDVV